MDLIFSNLRVVLIAILYFSKYHIANFFFAGDFPEDVDGFHRVEYFIYGILIVLAINYKSGGCGVKVLLESIFCGIVINNGLSLVFYNEIWYSQNDLLLIPLIFMIEYGKYRKINIRKYLDNLRRISFSNFNNDK
jgi:hypothetical protein